MTAVWVALIRHSELDEGAEMITVHTSRAGADKEVECTASALSVEWPQGVLDVPDALTLTDGVYRLPGMENQGDWMKYRIVQTCLQD
jgi:hypothetical protein